MNNDTIEVTLYDIDHIPSYRIAEAERQANEKERMAYMEDLKEKVNSGEYDPKDGITPTIGENGNWFLEDEDTGKPSRGERGKSGIYVGKEEPTEEDVLLWIDSDSEDVSWVASTEYVDNSIAEAKEELNENIANAQLGGEIDLSEYAKKEELHNHDNKSTLDSITTEAITNWNNKSEFNGSYNSLADCPNIPTKMSDLTNDSDFTTNEYVNGLVGNINTVLATLTTVSEVV